MKNYSIAEDYVLPSLGKVYSQNVNPNVKIRSMTTEEEMMRLAPSEYTYKNLCEIIDACLVDNPGISSYDMCMADYTFLLNKLRIVTYGKDYRVSSTCPYCANSNNYIIDLSELEVKEFNESEYASVKEFILPKTQKKITLKMQSPRMADEVETRNKEIKKQTHGQSTDTAFLLTLNSLIEKVDDEELDVVQKDTFVRKLPMMDTNYIIKKAEKFLNCFGIVPTLNHTCSLCGLDYTGSFRYTKEFFGPSID